MPRYDFRTPGFSFDAALAAEARFRWPRAGELPRQRPAPSRRRRAGVQRPRRRMARPPRGRGQKRANLAVEERTRGADAGRRPALPVRAAQACAARLHGAEGGRDGRVAPAAGYHPPHPGGAGQSRAHAGERDRGGRAMRHPQLAGDRRTGGIRAVRRRLEADRLLVFCDEDADVEGSRWRRLRRAAAAADPLAVAC